MFASDMVNRQDRPSEDPAASSHRPNRRAIDMPAAPGMDATHRIVPGVPSPCHGKYGRRVGGCRPLKESSSEARETVAGAAASAIKNPTRRNGAAETAKRRGWTVTPVDETGRRQDSIFQDFLPLLRELASGQPLSPPSYKHGEDPFQGHDAWTFQLAPNLYALKNIMAELDALPDGKDAGLLALNKACMRASNRWDAGAWGWSDPQWKDKKNWIRLFTEDAMEHFAEGNSLHADPTRAICANLARYYLDRDRTLERDLVWPMLVPIFVDKLLPKVAEALWGSDSVRDDSDSMFSSSLATHMAASLPERSQPCVKPSASPTLHKRQLAASPDVDKLTVVIDPSIGVTLHHPDGATTPLGRMQVHLPLIEGQDQREGGTHVEFDTLFDYLQDTLSMRNQVAEAQSRTPLVPEVAEDLDETMRRCLGIVWNKPGSLCERFWTEVATEWARRYDYYRMADLKGKEEAEHIAKYQISKPPVPMTSFDRPYAGPTAVLGGGAFVMTTDIDGTLPTLRATEPSDASLATSPPRVSPEINATITASLTTASVDAVHDGLPTRPVLGEDTTTASVATSTAVQNAIHGKIIGPVGTIVSMIPSTLLLKLGPTASTTPNSRSPAVAQELP